MSRLVGRRALITGASGGVGRALAVRLAECGVDCVLLARSIEGLEATADLVREARRQALPIEGDVTNADDRARAINACHEELGGLDLLVNNAGIGAHGRFHEASAERLRSLFEVNFFAAAELTREALPLLQQSDAACVTNIGSVLAWRGVPHKSEYCATKFALRGWSEAIRPELAKLGVHVLHTSPSTIATDFRSHLVEKLGSAPQENRLGVSPERVAKRIVLGIERGRNEVAITWEDWIIVHASRHVTGVLDWWLRRQG